MVNADGNALYSIRVHDREVTDHLVHFPLLSGERLRGSGPVA